MNIEKSPYWDVATYAFVYNIFVIVLILYFDTGGYADTFFGLWIANNFAGLIIPFVIGLFGYIRGKYSLKAFKISFWILFVVRSIPLISPLF